MKIAKIQDLKFDTEERIMAATLANENELVMLLSSGDVVRFNISEHKGEYLFSVKSSFTYEDGGFDINAKSTIYTLNSIVVIVNDYKRHGFIHYPEMYDKLHLYRGDYHADISCYPIALFKNEIGIPHLIYGKNWNHVQIMNLDTRQVLTASKSLIQENAEEKHLEFYKTHTEDNKLEWPRPYDYFYGKLEMAPNNKNFLSAGWAWGSYDAYNAYNVDHFIKSNRIKDINTGAWEHSNRATCWIDNKTIAITYSPYEEGEEGSTRNSPHEIHFCEIEEQKSEVIRKIAIKDLDLVNSEIQFCNHLNCIVLLSEKEGCILLSLDGDILLHHKEINFDKYFPDLNLFLEINNKAVSIYQTKN